MADPSGMQAALSVEAVEWAPGDDDKLTVAVRGRWRRRRPAWSGQPMLAIEAEGHRHRFPATPDPPSLAGGSPGEWRMTFSVPAWLAPYLGGRIWLQLGLATVPLPPPVGPTEGSGPGGYTGKSADPGAPAERSTAAAMLAAQRAAERQAEAEAAVAELSARVRELEDELELARREPERLRALVAQRDDERRAAEQRAHAERALRSELEERLRRSSTQSIDAIRIDAAELAAAEERVRELEDELELARRRADEAEQAAAAREAAVADQVEPPEREPGEERSVAAHQLDAVLAELRAELVRLAELAERESAAGDAAQARVVELEHRVAALERELQDRTLRTTRAWDEVEELRRLLREGFEGGAPEGDAPEGGAPEGGAPEGGAPEGGAPEGGAPEGGAPEGGAPEGDAPEGDAPEGDAPEGDAPPEAPDPVLPEEPDAGVERERFDAALARLREAAPEPEEVEQHHPIGPAATAPQAQPVKPWLGPAFAAMAERAPDTAGELLVGLLAAQGLVYPAPVAYDLVLGEGACIRVTSDGTPAGLEIEVAELPRPSGEASLRIIGDRAQLARLVAAGRARRWARRGAARVEGDRRALRALFALTREPRSLNELFSAGVRLESRLAFALAAYMVEPSWTAGVVFTTAHDSGRPPGPDAFLLARDGESLSVTDSPGAGRTSATITCPPLSLLGFLAGDPGVEATITGDPGHVLALLGWLERAQHG